MSDTPFFDAHPDQQQDPFLLFTKWWEDAVASEPADPNAMALATVDAQGLPNLRIVLLKEFSREGYVFYTNLESPKGQELFHTPYAALCFYWKSRARQVRIRGPVTRVSEARADAYHAARPRESRLSAWASQQSAPLMSRAELDERVTKIRAQFAGHEVPRPPFWSGFELAPLAIEFWQAGPFRLHDRVLFTRSSCAVSTWTAQRLFP